MQYRVTHCRFACTLDFYTLLLLSSIWCLCRYSCAAISRDTSVVFCSSSLSFSLSLFLSDLRAFNSNLCVCVCVFFACSNYQHEPFCHSTWARLPLTMARVASFVRLCRLWQGRQPLLPPPSPNLIAPHRHNKSSIIPAAAAEQHHHLYKVVVQQCKSQVKSTS